MIKQGSAFAALFACALLAACNGGGGNSDGGNNNGSGSGGTGPSPFQGFMAFSEFPVSGNQQMEAAVVPTSGSPSTIVANPAGFPQLMVNQISTNNSGVPTGFTHAGLVFVGGVDGSSNNHWFSVPFTAGTTPAATQIAADATTVCRQLLPGTFGGSLFSIDVDPVVVYRDLTVGSTAFIVYTTPGPDQNCGTLDDVTRVVNLQGSATQNTIALPGVPVAAVYHANGKLAGLVVYAISTNAVELELGLGTLYFLSDTTNFTSPTTLLSDVKYLSQALPDGSKTLLHGKQVFLGVIGYGPTASGLYRLDDQGVLSASLDQSPAIVDGSGMESTVRSIADATHLYYFLGSQLKSIPLDGSAPPTTIGNYSGGPYDFRGVTQNNLVLSQGNPVFVVPKAGTADSTTMTGITSSFELRYVTPNFLFLQSQSGVVPGQAVVTAEDGTLVQTVPLGEWAGARLGPDLSGGVLPQTTLSGILASVATSQSVDAGNSSVGDFTNATLAEVSLADGTTTNFTAPDGTPVTFTYVQGGIKYQSDVPVDAGTITTLGNAPDAYEFDFLNHFIRKISNDPTQQANLAIN